VYPEFVEVFESRGLLHWVWKGIREVLMRWEVQFILDEVAEKVNRVEGGIRIGEENLYLAATEKGWRSTSVSISRHW